ncbi:MAG TPA: CPBP family intramembrane glutamic endopeptidase [Gemmatimonadales bacterium]
MTARVSFGERAKHVALALGWIVLYALVGFPIWWVLSRLNPLPLHSPWRDASVWLAGCAAFLFATWVVGVRLAKQAWDHWGWHVQTGIGRSWLNGVGLGLLMAALAVGLAFVTSRATVRLTSDWPRYLTVAAPLALALASAALLEELWFRGYALRRLADAVGPWAAMIVVSLGFAAAHLTNPAVGAIGVLNIALAGVWLSFAFFSPAGMPLAWGLHFGWNAGLGLVFDAPVSGFRLRVPAVEYAPGKLAWVDGGAFGPEGGVVATVVLMAGTLAVLGGRFKQPKEWLV